MRPVNKFIKCPSRGARIIYIIVITVLLISLLFLRIYPKVIPYSLADLYGRDIFEFVSLPGNTVSALFTNSVTEMFAVIGSVALFAAALRFLYKTVEFLVTGDKGKFRAQILRNVTVVLIICNILAASFALMHGINYRRTPASYVFGITGSEDCPRSYSEYLNALTWAYNGMVSARKMLGEDYNGVAHMKSTYEESVLHANMVLNAMSGSYGLELSPNFIRAKAVSLSRLWSYTHIVGVYDPFLGEANINTDYMDILDFPVTLCHEIVHAKGYAREYDANTIAILTCIHSERADFRYAGYYHIFINLYPRVAEYAQAVGEQMPDLISSSDMDAVRRDLAASESYWEYIDNGELSELIESLSEDANNAFLESNGQEGGTATYEVKPNIYVEFYLRYVEGTADD